MSFQLQPPTFSVIVPAYNAAPTITSCINALQRQINIPGDYEIIVVDDGSTDDTAALAQASGAQVIHQQKRGPANARNVGIHAAKGSIVCFTDADCQPTPTWLSEIVTPLLGNSDIAGCKGAYCCRQTELFARFVQIEYEDKYDVLQSHQYITFMDFYSASYRRQILLDIGGFNEQFIANSEDRELSYRLADCGYKMVFQRSALVCHVHSDSFWKYALKKVYNGYWTALAVRHYPMRMKDDTYTPQVQKVQIALMALLLITAAPGLFFPSLLLAIAGGVALMFFLTTLPFTVKAWRKDRTVAIVSPLLLALRALTLGIGFAWGWIRLLTSNQSAAETKT